MKRRKRGSTAESHDWDARAAKALEEARAMPPGASQDQALRLAEQLQTAAKMKNYLGSGELKPPK